MARAALAWAAGRPGITSVLAGARTPAQVAENAASVEEDEPQSLLEALSAVGEDLRNALGADPDMWQSPGRTR
jgi:aryl-alcohol dehydrogenase-like predicted oxidoreductase